MVTICPSIHVLIAYVTGRKCSHIHSAFSFCLWSTLVAQTCKFLRFLKNIIETNLETRREGVGKNNETAQGWSQSSAIGIRFSIGNIGMIMLIDSYLKDS